MDHEVETPVEPTAEKTSRWEDYIDVFFSPVELFRRRAADRVAPPLITLLVLAILFYIVMMPANAMVMRATQAAAAPEAAQAMEAMQGVFQIVGGVMVPVIYMIVLATTAALLWLIGRFADIRITFNRAMLIATYGGFIYLLGQIAGGVAVLIHGEAGLDIARHLSFGPARFIASSDTPAALLAVLRRFEITAIWQAVIWMIGVREIYRTTTARAAVVAFMVWLLGVIPGIIGGLFQGMQG